jgi:tetratricopeptide (TPR) repeat protein
MNITHIKEISIEMPLPSKSFDFKTTTEKATNGDIEAQIDLGRYYYQKANDNNDENRIEHDKSLKLAKYWFIKGLDKKYPTNEVALGVCYVKEGNYVDAHKMLNKHINKDVLAKLAMAKLYEKGKRNYDRPDTSFKLYKSAAEDNKSIRAMYELGVAYFIGRIVERDLVEAEKWLRMALNNGFNEAKNILDLIDRVNNGEDMLNFIKNSDLHMHIDGRIVTLSETKKMAHQLENDIYNHNSIINCFCKACLAKFVNENNTVEDYIKNISRFDRQEKIAEALLLMPNVLYTLQNLGGCQFCIDGTKSTIKNARVFLSQKNNPSQIDILALAMTIGPH